MKIPKDILDLRLNNEIIMPVVEGRGRYFVSNKGRVFSYYRNKAKILKFGHQKSGHVHVNISFDGVSRSTKVHHLVLEAFEGPCPEGCEVRHFNGIPYDNNYNNLLYGTRKENMEDAVRLGTTPKGKRNGQVKLDKRQIQEIRELYKNGGITHKDLSIKYGVSRRHIGDIINKVCWGWLK